MNRPVSFKGQICLLLWRSFLRPGTSAASPANCLGRSEQLSRLFGGSRGPRMNAVPTGNEANVAFEAYMPIPIVVHT